ncbi:MAG: RluA family pseudouridine synthase [Cytophagaceae bacterium]
MSFSIHIPDHILFEDEYMVAIHKPAGLMVEPDRNGHKNLLQQVQQFYRKKVGKGKELYVQHVHRLDRPTSGIVLFAKKKSILKLLSEQFAQRVVTKKYQALTEKKELITSATLNQFLFKDKKNMKAVITAADFPETEAVSLTYQLSEYKNDFWLWDIHLHTGKYHQIRAQLSSQDAPIIGDHYYGSTIEYGESKIALHAYQLTIVHPIQEKEITFQAEATWLI